MLEKDFHLHINGETIKVSKEVYREYKHTEEKYFMKRLKKGQFLSKYKMRFRQ